MVTVVVTVYPSPSGCCVGIVAACLIPLLSYILVTVCCGVSIPFLKTCCSLSTLVSVGILALTCKSWLRCILSQALFPAMALPKLPRVPIQSICSLCIALSRLAQVVDPSSAFPLQVLQCLLPDQVVFLPRIFSFRHPPSATLPDMQADPV